MDPNLIKLPEYKVSLLWLHRKNSNQDKCGAGSASLQEEFLGPPCAVRCRKTREVHALHVKSRKCARSKKSSSNSRFPGIIKSDVHPFLVKHFQWALYPEFL